MSSNDSNSNDNNNSGADQLVSFFLYSLFIYPIANYLVSPQRKYPKWKGIIFAILFLSATFAIQIMYENADKGPNHYQLLNVTRGSNLHAIKKSYRSLSLELHPDKNKADNAADEFLKVKQAFDVLSIKDMRREYNRLGDAGVHAASQTVVDHKYILIQIIVYYFSSLIFAFMMTLSETSGDTFVASLFGLSVMLLLEMLFVLQEIQLPDWFLPHYTPHDVITFLHRFFPAFMNGCRCIIGAFQVDFKIEMVGRLETLHAVTREVNVRVGRLSKLFEQLVDDPKDSSERDFWLELDDNRKSTGQPLSEGFMTKQLRLTQKKASQFSGGKSADLIHAKMALIKNPANLRTEGGENKKWKETTTMFGYLLIYLLARYLVVKDKR